MAQQKVYGAFKRWEQNHHWELTEKKKRNWIIVTLLIRLEILL
jgi:hypothetical protein